RALVLARLVRGPRTAHGTPLAHVPPPGPAVATRLEDESSAVKAAQRARWEKLADSLGGPGAGDDDSEEIDADQIVESDDLVEEDGVEPAPLPPIMIRPRRMTEPPDVVAADPADEEPEALADPPTAPAQAPRVAAIAVARRSGPVPAIAIAHRSAPIADEEDRSAPAIAVAHRSAPIADEEDRSAPAIAVAHRSAPIADEDRSAPAIAVAHRSAPVEDRSAPAIAEENRSRVAEDRSAPVIAEDRSSPMIAEDRWSAGIAAANRSAPVLVEESRSVLAEESRSAQRSEPVVAEENPSANRSEPVEYRSAPGVVEEARSAGVTVKERTVPVTAVEERTVPVTAVEERTVPVAAVAPVGAWQPGTTAEIDEQPWPVAPASSASGATSAPAAGTTGTTTPSAEVSPPREPTLIIREEEPPPAASRTKTGDDKVVVTERAESSDWSDPRPLAELLDRDSRRDLGAAAGAVVTSATTAPKAPVDDLDDFGVGDDDDDDLDLGDTRARHAPKDARLEVLDDLPDADLPPPAPVSGAADGRDFARQLRAKMSQMAQRLFAGADAAAPAPQDLAPRHDHSTEIDLSSLGDELPLGGGVTEIEARAVQRVQELREVITSPGTWDSQVRERGLPDHGELMRGVSDAAHLLAKMFASGATGRIGFRRDDVEKVVFFDQGRPVFASSSEQRDRMGELLVREGKITAAQYERCQTVVAESGRRMGEILVDFGYLKRRELLPAVRRHVEDIVYSLFGWDRGHYHITIDPQPSGERIRLSRHPAALILEGIRRKLDRTSLERMIGPPSTVIEVGDRERLGGIINVGDLAAEERGALAAIDGQADLAQVARVAGVDITDVLPLAWGLCVLGLATLRRTDTEVLDESTALVGETDLAIDRERVRARWQLVTDSDYFALLGVRRDATAFEIRRAYQSARRDFAADCFPQDLRRELAQELDDIANVLDEAFRVLRDDRLRVTYLSNLVE
ncbi:MAG: DUF4388 domain-containing protein, partial [Deltaproteobacteria bacterium]|nr:DUF4388 domain-containing protein [Deltaproteobacteria bacterium]